MKFPFDYIDCSWAKLKLSLQHTDVKELSTQMHPAWLVNSGLQVHWVSLPATLTVVTWTLEKTLFGAINRMYAHK